jgi:hypothetical protein
MLKCAALLLNMPVSPILGHSDTTRQCHHRVRIQQQRRTLIASEGAGPSSPAGCAVQRTGSNQTRSPSSRAVVRDGARAGEQLADELVKWLSDNRGRSPKLLLASAMYPTTPAAGRLSFARRAAEAGDGVPIAFSRPWVQRRGGPGIGDRAPADCAGSAS